MYVLFRAVFCGCIAVLIAQAGEAPVTCTADQVAQFVAKAPKPPVDLGLDLTLRLVDYVDFTDPKDPHDHLDRSTSHIVKGAAGSYRETAAHRHAQFAVRWKSAGKDAPHVLVFEYPDDAKREICFFTHESGLGGGMNHDWSLETGVYCGSPGPLSGVMQYHTLFFWPNDAWPVAMVMNWARSGAPAAASRLWVYAVDGGLPKLDVVEPAPSDPRLFGTIYNWSLVPTRGIFGLTNRDTALEHIADYHLYRGDNLLCWPVVANNTWGFRCQIPAWDGGSGKQIEQIELDRILKVCEAKGLRFLPVFNTGKGFTIDGKQLGADNREAYAAGFRKGMDQFFERYGAAPALQGIAFDTQDLSPQYGEAGLDYVRDCFGGIDKFTAYLKDKAPRLKAYNFLGGRHIHDQYFHDAGEVVGRWESARKPWSDFLGGEVETMWKSWSRDPAQLKAVPGLTTVASYQNDDHAIFDTYYHNPRAMFYEDLEASPAKARLLDTRAALVWNTFFEGYIGLTPTNWWYQKLWVAPDFCPAPPLALSGWNRAMLHRDRNVLMSGAWNCKGGGQEAALRRFARAYRSLPPNELTDVVVSGSSPVCIRSGVYGGKTYASALNPSPFPAIIAIDIAGEKKTLTLTPCGLETLVVGSEGKVTASGDVGADYARWINQRLAAFESLYNEVKALDAKAAPAAFAAHLANAKQLAMAGRWLAADVALGHGLTVELELRRRILAPPQQSVPRLSVAPTMRGDLDAWPTDAADVRSTDANIGTHLFFTSQWEGAKDLSARVRVGHDGSKLYVGIAVADDVLCAKDGISLMLSPTNYRQWLPQDLKSEKTLSMGLPLKEKELSGSGAGGFAWTSRRTKEGYVVEASLDMATLSLKQGSQIGWLLQISEDDNTKSLMKAGWARKCVLLMPNVPAFAFDHDPRSCGELIIK
ncbi:MAG: sugar-binding protein [Planctomycetota bacterium]